MAAIRSINAKRIVLDSFSALSMSFTNRIESRITVQVFLGKIMRAEGITTLIISEIPYGSTDLGNGIEESVADAVIKLEHGPDNASPIFLKVLKMRELPLIEKSMYAALLATDWYYIQNSG